ncbi:hypothetical protein [Pseudarthrobacter enclensis]|uniref:hypothetical protein n=1 Tax=Pseudarthrobacter enclensis TaxID=993070 RepID=UPI003EDE7FDF
MAGLGALRPGRRSGASKPRLLAVLLVLALGVLFAPPARAVDYGHDVSWPQCPGGLPMPPDTTEFLVVGLTRGLAFTENPCLQQQYQWVLDRGIRAQAYAMATFPTAAQYDTYGGAGPYPAATRPDRLRNVGYAEGRAALASLTRIGWRPERIWVDVEPRPAQPWPSTTAAERQENRYVIFGLLAALGDAGFPYGFYSYASAWDAITGSWQLPGVPVWSPAGRLDVPSEASDLCVTPSFSGGTVHLTQWTDGTYDYDMTCTNVYQAHVATLGWQPSVADGATAGTTGRALPLESLRLAVAGDRLAGDILWRGHVQNLGWQQWTTAASAIGTTGLGLRLEAFQLRLTGDLASQYSIRYRAHVQNTGWQPYAVDGATAGTVGRGLRMEAVTIELIPKVQPAFTAQYTAHVQNLGWTPTVADGTVAGTTGQALRVEALRLTVASTTYTGDIQWRGHVENVGWQPWVSSANPIGTTGQGLRLEAFDIRLTGELADHYSIHYRAHVQDVGWQPFTADGGTAGTTGQGKRIEAVQILLVPRAG